MNTQGVKDVSDYDKEEMDELVGYKGYSILMRILEDFWKLKLKQNIEADGMPIPKELNIRVVTEKENYLRIVEVGEGGVCVITDKNEREIYLEWSDVKAGSMLDAAYEIKAVKSKLLV